MGIFVSQQHILKVAEKLAAAPLSRGPVSHSAAEDNFRSAIDNLSNIISTGEANQETASVVQQHIDRLEGFANLGVIIRGKFQPIAPSIVAANHDAIRPGAFISGKRFLVVTREFSDWFLSEDEDFQIDLPKWWINCKDVTWDETSGSMVYLGYWFRRNPKTIIPQKDIEKYNLHEFELEKRINARV